MRKIKKITIMLMSVMLLIGMFGINAFAAGTTGNPEILRFEIKKTIHIDKNVQTLPSFEFTYSIQQITSLEEMTTILNSSDALDIQSDLKGLINLSGFIRTEEENEVPLPSVKVTFDVADGFARSEFAPVADDPDVYYYSTSQLLLGPDGASELKPDDFPEVGFYVYKVTENPIAWASSATAKYNVKQTPADEVICSGAEYIMIIPVGWSDHDSNADTPDIKAFIDRDSIILKTKNDDGTSADVKVTVPEFVNVYQRNDSDAYGLEISKQVRGEYASPNKEFTFSIDIDRNATEQASVKGYTYEIYNRTYETDENGALTGKYLDVPVNGSAGEILFDRADGATQTFTLKHNQVLKFDKFPVGTTYTFTEEPDDYVPEALVTEGTAGTTTLNASTKNVEEDGTLIGKKLNTANEKFVILEGQDKVDVTNTYADIVVTGIVTDNLFFILLIVVAVTGMAAYTVIKKRLRTC